MGSRFAGLGNEEAAYILGLWCADGSHRTSSSGLSPVDARNALNDLRLFSPKLLQQT